MILQCDLHIHSALSPCADDDMSPGNIVGMSFLNGLQVISITDHQSCLNVRSAMAATEQLEKEHGKRVLIIPGMEVECQEGFHLLAYFPDIETAERFGEYLERNRLIIPNKPDIFGRQILFDEFDEEMGIYPNLLLTSCDISSIELANKVFDEGGVMIPAHIDRDSYSILTSLGTIPPEFPGHSFELSMNCDMESFFAIHPELKRKPFIIDSDAHHLASISTGFSIDFPGISAETLDTSHIVQALREKTMK
jgi:PHP family Zn ribbon phosphoesterase